MFTEPTGRQLDFRRLYELHERERYSARKKQMRAQRIKDWLGMVVSALMLMAIGMVVGQIRAANTQSTCQTCAVEEAAYVVTETQSR